MLAGGSWSGVRGLLRAERCGGATGQVFYTFFPLGDATAMRGYGL